MHSASPHRLYIYPQYYMPEHPGGAAAAAGDDCALRRGGRGARRQAADDPTMAILTYDGYTN